MILVDSSVWVDHQRSKNPELSRLLEEGWVYPHPFVIGELAMGSFKNRQMFLDSLLALPEVAKADDLEVLRMVESHQMAGKGLGLIDAHLLASALIDRVRLYTLDVALDRMARALGVCWGPRPH
jgi:predicted nucleic acid-binding protein